MPCSKRNDDDQTPEKSNNENENRQNLEKSSSKNLSSYSGKCQISEKEVFLNMLFIIL